MTVSVFPLHEPLIDAVVAFANLELHPRTFIFEIRNTFVGTWRPDKVPTRKTCLAIQQEVRHWLTSDLRGSAKDRPLIALLGKRRVTWTEVARDGTRGPTHVSDIRYADRDHPALANAKLLEEINLAAEFDEVFDPGIHLGGKVDYVVDKDGAKVTWSWSVTKASLRSLCGLAVASILQAGLADRVGLCARQGCSTYYINRTSRGVSRKYCKTPACEKALNVERVKASRRKR